MRRLRTAIVATSLALLIVACGIAVPDVKSMTVEQATATLKTAGFTVGVVTYDEKATGATGAVVRQEPNAGTGLKAGSSIALTVAGPSPVAVPDLAGMSRDAAQSALQAAGLSLGAVSESWDTSIAAGTVARQDPSAGTSSPKDSAIAVTISKGPEPVAVPKVTGKTRAQATSLLAAAGFAVKVATKSDSVKKGIVFAQSPGASVLAQPGTRVTISVSTGVAMVRVPRVIGKYPDDAAGILRAAGLKVHELSIHGPIDSDAGNAEIGQVYRQTPKAGTLVPKGTTVTIRDWWEAG